MLNEITKLLGELIGRNDKLCTNIQSILSQVQDKCTDQQLKQIQQAVFMNLNHNAIIVAMRQLNCIETINTQLNLIADQCTDIKTKAQLRELSANIDLALTGLKNVNNRKH